MSSVTNSTDLDALLQSLAGSITKSDDYGGENDIARYILFECLISDDSDMLENDVSIAAWVIDATLEADDPESRHNHSALSPRAEDLVRPPEDSAQQYEVELQAENIMSLLTSAFLIGAIIAKFLIDVLLFYASASLILGPSGLYRFIEGNDFRDMINRVRDGSLNTMMDVERELLGKVEPPEMEPEILPFGPNSDNPTPELPEYEAPESPPRTNPTEIIPRPHNYWYMMHRAKQYTIAVIAQGVLHHIPTVSAT
ncbi:hypothetical protein K440DRAFT_670436 [Wilcoxina mikolae CBS 423.85]|nr:hypothetical protein K440DRAFT_670436 [Wilcoxina mikolae CBS 423.85]